jgi:hypothetical protein
MPMDCKDAEATDEMGRAFVCARSPDVFFSLASLATGMLRRKIESTIVINVFFILTSCVIGLRNRWDRVTDKTPDERRLRALLK